MAEGKWLNEAIHTNEIMPGVLNLVKANVGCGKTTWAIGNLKQNTKDKTQGLFLIDTVAARDQMYQKEEIDSMDWDWEDRNINSFSEYFGDYSDGKIVCLTYGKIGKIALEYPNFGYGNLKYVICDELHDLIKFATFDRNPNNLHQSALRWLQGLMKTGCIIIVITATPRLVESYFKNCINYISVDSGLRSYANKETQKYSSIFTVLPTVPTKTKSIIYTPQIKKMKIIEEKMRSNGHTPISIWSVGNKDNPMSQEQINAREELLKECRLPKGYDTLIINASCGTSINIKDSIDLMIIDTSVQDDITQVRGRCRSDLDKLLYLDSRAPIDIPDAYLDVRLFNEDKEKLCICIGLHDAQGHLLGATSLKKRIIQEGKYTITDGREKNKRYWIIHQMPNSYDS